MTPPASAERGRERRELADNEDNPQASSARAANPAPRGILGRCWPWLAAASSGLLLALCFPPFNQGWLAWLGLTPLIAAVWSRRGTHRAPVLLGYVAGLVFFTVAFHWLSALGELFASPALHGLPLLLALYMGSYLALWGWFLARIVRPEERFTSSLRNLRTGALAACAWVALEWIRGWFLYGGWGWNGLGVALHRDLPMIQIADVTGVLGLSWLVAFCNVMAVIVARRVVTELGPQFLKSIRWEFSLTMALVALVFAYGVRALFEKPPAHATPLRVTAIQPNIPQDVKMFARDAEDEIFPQLDGLTAQASTLKYVPVFVWLGALPPQLSGWHVILPPQLVLWPEAATPRGMYADQTNFRFVMDQAARGDFSLLIGTLDAEPDPSDPEGQRMHEFNAAALLSQGGREVSMYRKMHLVPFGEFLPLRGLMPALVQRLVPGDLQAGSQPSPLSLANPPLRLGVLICFEDTLGDLTRKFVKNGADLLVNLTNDGWFIRTAAAEQHLANAVFRAVENRRPLVRCANTGVTCAVDRAGRVDRGHLATFTQGFAPFTVPVPTGAETTFYTRHGDWIAHVSVFIAAAPFAMRGWRRLRRGKGDAIESGR